MEQNDSPQKQNPLSWVSPNAQKPAAPAAQAVTKPSVPATAMANSSTGKYVGMVVVGVIAGILVAWAWTAGRTSSPADPATASTEQDANASASSTSTPAQGADPALSIMSPQTPGTTVTISKAIVDRPTWVVIYENKDGKPGNALGATLFFPERQAGSVSLLRATMSGRSYLAVKQVDDGDRKFELRGDQYLSEGGEVQWVTFEVR